MLSFAVGSFAPEHSGDDPFAIKRIRLEFEDWDWFMTEFSANGEARTGITDWYANYVIEQEGMGLVCEMTYLRMFGRKTYLQIIGHHEPIWFAPKGWDLLGYDIREWDVQIDSQNTNWHADEFLFGANGVYLLVSLETNDETKNPNEPSGRFFTGKEAAQWCESHRIQLALCLTEFETVRVLTPMNARELCTPGCGLGNQNGGQDAQTSQTEAAEDLRTDKQKRNDWLLNLRGLEKDPALTLPELADLLTNESLATDWANLEANAISDALRESYSRQFCKAWPFDARGKRRKKV